MFDVVDQFQAYAGHVFTRVDQFQAYAGHLFTSLVLGSFSLKHSSLLCAPGAPLACFLRAGNFNKCCTGRVLGWLVPLPQKQVTNKGAWLVMFIRKL